MILCSQCGNELEEGLRFCAECSTQMGIGLGSDPVESVKVSSNMSGGLAAHANDAQASRTQPFASVANAEARAASALLPPRSRNTLRTIMLTAIAIVLLSGLGGILIWASLRKEGGSENNKTLPAAESSNQTVTTKPNDLQPAKRPVPQPTLTNDSSISQEVINTLNGWAAATSRHDLDAHMSFYADVLHTYYGRKHASASFVRSNRTPAFTRYYELNTQLSNISITPDPSGARATAIFDKSYVFKGEKELSGSVRQMAWLERIGNRWLITGEKDLQVYYVNR